MKILHTSDWHLGQNFFTKNRKEEHQAFIDWLLDVVLKHDIDAIIIAGDVFDTGAPPSYAREMYNQFIVKINQLGVTLVVLGGNHDSVSMLNESKQLLACLNTYVIANTSEELTDQVLVLNDRQGQPGVIICAVPFIRPRDVVQSSAGDSSIDKNQALGAAIKRHYEKLHQLALTTQARLQQETNKTLPIVATGHLTALGVTSSESVRDIYIGSLEAFDAKAFPPVDYIALGHIHRPQIVAKSDSIRYSGSPIPLSFDEIKGVSINDESMSNKQIVLIEFTDQNKRIEPISVPLFQPMATLKGTLESLEQQLQQFEHCPQTVWLCIHVEHDDYLSDLQSRIQAITEGYNVEVLQLRRSRTQQSQSLTQQSKETLAELTPYEVFNKRLSIEHFEGEQAELRKQRISEQFQQIVMKLENDMTETEPKPNEDSK
ncbi:exonuclease subunit SbcD [Vibrio aphrogenes]|uniref:exonuclease subunit SbcD n=1 Tax=Vibrio aphrogenes TaxID=1891186 RepID=UPI000B35295D|nr:exonuclease subunit SbcD [Vibrio aphrogenes]